MATQSSSARPARSRPGITQEPFAFHEVLRDELTVIAARRNRLSADRGDLVATGPPTARAPSDTAWQARLLGLAFSGGGIRSATFNLGVLQALARRGLLRYVDYLSTVSGGGYIGSWLTALCQRRFARERARDANPYSKDAPLDFDRQGFVDFEKRLAWSAGDGGDLSAPDREDGAVRFLREFSNYLTPKLGIFSGDTWALIAIYVRNALLNQLVLLLALAGALLSPRLLSSLLGEAEAGNPNGFLTWMAAVFVVHLGICWKLGKNLAGVTATNGDAEPAPLVIRWIGVPLLFIGFSAASWLGRLGDWLASVGGWLFPPGGGAAVPPGDWRTWVVAAIVGTAVSLFTWCCACASARWHQRATPWTATELKFWKRMVGYSLASGPVFGLLLHAVGGWLGSEVYSGFRLIAGLPALALALLVAGALHVGLAGKNINAQYVEWLSRLGGLMLIGAAGWIAFNGLVFMGPLVVAWLGGVLETAIASGWVLTTLGSVIFGRSVAASSRALPRLFMQVAPWIFIVGLGVALAASLQAGLHLGVTSFSAQPAVAATCVADAAAARADVYTPDPAAAPLSLPTAALVQDYGCWLDRTEPWEVVVGAMALAFALTWLLSVRIDINVFSLHGMYANRLVRCYLGASVAERKANPFSGLSSRDDLPLQAVRRTIGGRNMLIHAREGGDIGRGEIAGDAPVPRQPAVYPGPYHLVNTAINLVAGGNLAYQERKAGAFLLSPLYCGFQQDGSSSEGSASQPIDVYRASTEFSSWPRPLTLGEAVATSGAAASPNMGYHSTPAFAFLMGVFNIRLGRWVGNPHMEDPKAEKTWRKSGPKVALWHLLREVFGLTDKTSGFVYLSDGGHFENLGIYELVRRRCRYIIACDAGADERYGFEDLANAIRKCRTDLGVEIDLDVNQIAVLDDGRYNAAPCAVGQVFYSEKDIGTILYIKASRRRGLPADVMNYASEHPSFPHESTADQFFSESQFESYRRLGHFLAGEIIGVSRVPGAASVDVDQLFRELAERWYRPSRAIASNFSRLAEQVDAVFERLRSVKELGFLSHQFYPQWRSLLGQRVIDPAAQAEDLQFVPHDDEEQLRQGFYFCNSLIQLMESAYLDLNLETDWQHPDNSGWLNVFHHWAWSGMFRVTWAVSAATYGGRFRAFCERRLNLKLGEVNVTQVLPNEAGDRSFAGSGLNSHEQRQIEKLGALTDHVMTVHRLELHVRHPIAEAGAKPLIQFGFGYALLKGDDLVMYRVQDHLRGMGLGRKGLVALVEARKAPIGLELLDVERLLGFLKDFLEHTDRAKLADFRAMVVSVNEEWDDRGA
jgi:hypothetical protein